MYAYSYHAARRCADSETITVCRINLFTRKTPGLQVCKLVFFPVLMANFVLLRVKQTFSEPDSLWKS